MKELQTVQRLGNNETQESSHTYVYKWQTNLYTKDAQKQHFIPEGGK